MKNHPRDDVASVDAGWYEPSRVMRCLKTIIFSILAGMLGAASGCQVGPDHTPPMAPITNQWKFPEPTGCDGYVDCY